MEAAKDHFIGNYLKILRRKGGYSQEEIAALLSVKRSTYARYEAGTLRPSVAKLAKLADHYQVSLDFLCRAPEEKPSDEEKQSGERKKTERITQEDLSLLGAYHRLNDREQKAVRRMVMELAEK